MMMTNTLTDTSAPYNACVTAMYILFHTALTIIIRMEKEKQNLMHCRLKG